MSNINEILTLDLNEDIKNVIDLEDRSEIEIQQEIEAYIVTEGIGSHLYNFINQFTSNIKETGVWLSGFYGSGKSYFGKMLGYIIDNPTINGTSARERFIPRIKGISNESIIENSIRKLESIKSRVVFLDIAKQNTDRGLAFTLFANLLKNLGFRDDIYGYVEFDLYLDGKIDEFKKIVEEAEKQKWDQIKKSNRQVAKVMRDTFIKMGYSDSNYTDTFNIYSSSINDFSASKFKIEIEKYLKIKNEETIVFVFDEASEAISQKKFTLLDLEGISESLSSISNKVWTIAIAQEKLDDVINNANVNRSQLTKVTDRFKTKIHLESTEVDVIIKNRLLKKTEEGNKNLKEFYKKNEGLVSDATNLKSSFPTKTSEFEIFSTYYPFHKYQFDILQKFLFSSNALVATQIAARGMIITTFDVLRKQMRDKKLYDFVSGHAICTEAQTSPPIGLANKYDTAKKILKEQESAVDGEKLLKTIHLLSDSEVVSPTLENITKSYISDIKTYYDVKPLINKALELLVDSKVLLLSNNNYKITSDLEGKFLEEMKSFEVELFSKKRSLINYIKEYKLFNSVATFNDGNDSFKFSVMSDQDDELTGAGTKQLQLIVYSLFNVNENRQDFIEQIKIDTQHQKDRITLVPDTKYFNEIDKLILEISRYTYMEETYSNESDSLKRQIIRDFSMIREEKSKDLRIKIEDSYKNASLVYMFDENLINADTFKGIICEAQRRLVKNIFTKRLTSQLSDDLVPKIFNSRKENLYRLFSGDEFKFYDNHGNFIGEHLKVIEEINAKIKTRYVDGKTLELELSNAPWGYSFGTIVTSLAVLLRSGRLSIKYDGDTWFSHEQTKIQEAFNNATRFKTASFKTVTATLTANQKSKAVQLLMDLDLESHTNKKIDWSINDFDLADTIKNIAEHFISSISALNETIESFEQLFPKMLEQKQNLLNFTGKVTENNYIEKVEYLLSNSVCYQESIQSIIRTQSFIKKNFSKVKNYKLFIDDVLSELKKADKIDSIIVDANNEFQRLYKQDMVQNYGTLQQHVQTIKDQYYKLMKNAVSLMSNSYQLLNAKVDSAIHNIKKLPQNINANNQNKLDELKRYCNDRILKDINPDYSTKCKNCGYSLSDILNYTDLIPTKENELCIIQAGFILEEAKEESNEPVVKKPRKIKFQVPGRIITVKDYKSILTLQLSLLASAKPDEEIEIDIETL